MQRNRQGFLLHSLLLTLLLAIPALAAPIDQTTRPEPGVASAPTEEAAGFVATRAIIRDAKTGAVRMPNRAEVAELVRTLKSLTSRAPEGAESAAAAGGVKVDLEGSHESVIIARATEDGGMETLCITTFDEAAAFLGLKPGSTSGAQGTTTRGGE